MVAVDLKGFLFCPQIIGSIMRRCGYGTIINLSSAVATTFMPGCSVHAAVEAGVGRLTRAMGVE